jgi:cAMP-binding proteins - catabolite gene activator and regulatory subunit of cAMP-dependent protein kinases
LSLTFKEALQKLIRISEKEAQAFMDLCYRKQFAKKSSLSEQASVIDEVYFLEKGLIRVLVNDRQGAAHTLHFAVEGQFIADYRAFLNRQSSRYQLEALEHTEVVVMPRRAIEWGYQNLAEGEKLGRLIAEYYFLYLDTRVEHLYTLSPLQRYSLMNELFPGIHQRVPQHMIASYLGITPIHLSRLKSGLKKP